MTFKRIFDLQKKSWRVFDSYSSFRCLFLFVCVFIQLYEPSPREPGWRFTAGPKYLFNLRILVKGHFLFKWNISCALSGVRLWAKTLEIPSPLGQNWSFLMKKMEVSESIQRWSGNIPWCLGSSKIINFKCRNWLFMKSQNTISASKLPIWHGKASFSKNFGRDSAFIYFIHMVRSTLLPLRAPGGPSGENRWVHQS